jgi:transcriptional antiterminator NusG
LRSSSFKPSIVPTKTEADEILSTLASPELRDLNFAEGERVRITQRPFENFAGQIGSIDTERGRLKLHVDVFGRVTPLEVHADEIVRI